MSGWSADEVAALMERAGLTGELFDPEVIAADLTERTRQAETLAALLAEPAPAVVTAWDPRWWR